MEETITKAIENRNMDVARAVYKRNYFFTMGEKAIENVFKRAVKKEYHEGVMWLMSLPEFKRIPGLLELLVFVVKFGDYELYKRFREVVRMEDYSIHAAIVEGFKRGNREIISDLILSKKDGGANVIDDVLREITLEVFIKIEDIWEDYIQKKKQARNKIWSLKKSGRSDIVEYLLTSNSKTMDMNSKAEASNFLGILSLGLKKESKIIIDYLVDIRDVPIEVRESEYRGIIEYITIDGFKKIWSNSYIKSWLLEIEPETLFIAGMNNINEYTVYAEFLKEGYDVSKTKNRLIMQCEITKKHEIVALLKTSPLVQIKSYTMGQSFHTEDALAEIQRTSPDLFFLNS